MDDNSTRKRHLRVVLVPDPNSLISVEPLSLLLRSASREGICWSRTPVRPYLAVILGGAREPKPGLGATGKPSGVQGDELRSQGGRPEGDAK